MRFWAGSRCQICKAPLDICMIGSVYEMLFWLLWQDITDKDIRITNSVYYKRIGKKWVHLCLDCFQPVPKFQISLKRELTGTKSFVPKTNIAFNDEQLDFMIRSMIQYEKSRYI
jgi:hypothetical protein